MSEAIIALLIILIIYAVRAVVKLNWMQRQITEQNFDLLMIKSELKKLNSSGGKPSALQMEAGVSESLTEIRSPENCVPKSPASIIQNRKTITEILQEDYEEN
jgi:hypothetical protein